MNTQVTIRNYEHSDKKAVMSVFDSNAPKFFSIDEREDLDNYLENEIEFYYVAEEEGKIVGSGGINTEKEKNKGIISWGMIHANHHRKGVGKILLNHRVSELLKMKQIDSIIVRTSQLVFPFYEKNGFELNTIQKDYWAKGFDLYEMNYKK